MDEQTESPDDRYVWAVTDHAVVRWLERVVGLDVANLRRQIADSPAVRQAIHMSAGGHQTSVRHHAERAEIVVRDGSVTTIKSR